MELLLICIMLMLFAGAVIMCVAFGRKANTVFRNKADAALVSVANMQQEYSRCLSNRSNVCGIIYVKVLEAVNKNGREAETVSTAGYVKSLLLKTFASNKNMIAAYIDNDYIIFTECGEIEVDRAVEEVSNKLKAYMKENDIFGNVNVIFGVYYNPSNDISFDEAVERAKLAYRYAKQCDRDIAAWNYKIHTRLTDNDKLKKNIFHEVENNNFYLQWQPIVDPHTGKPIMAEVLSRLNSAEQGLLNPGQFLPVLSEVGAIEQFDYYIFEKSCKWLSARIKMGKPYMSISINFFRETIANEEFLPKIMEILERYEIPRGAVKMEVLEENLRTEQSNDILTENLWGARERGILVMLDDFGVGTSSFADIQNYPVDIVKIDRSLVVNSNTPKGYSILKNIINLAKDIGLLVICEGVDNAEQYEIIKSFNDVLIQGFYCYKPMQLTDFEKLIEENVNKGDTHGVI